MSSTTLPASVVSWNAGGSIDCGFYGVENCALVLSCVNYSHVRLSGTFTKNDGRNSNFHFANLPTAARPAANVDFSSHISTPDGWTAMLRVMGAANWVMSYPESAGVDARKNWTVADTTWALGTPGFCTTFTPTSVPTLLPTSMPTLPANAMSGNAELQAAVTAWCNNSATAATTYGHISTWNTKRVTDMSWLFTSTSSSWVEGEGICSTAWSFNDDISKWDVSNVETFVMMFNGAHSFNQNLTAWNTSSATNMNLMFRYATAFNGDISSFDTSRVTHMSGMFSGAKLFNMDISSWQTGSVVSMSNMFRNDCCGSIFNQDLSAWDTSSVTNMESMFYEAIAFDQDISSWQISDVTTFANMLNGASSFSQTLCWDVSGATTTTGMFSGTSGGSVTGSDSCEPTSLPTLLPTTWPETHEYTALSSLYAATGGSSSWYTNTRWMDGDACTNSWYGIGCDAGRVSSVSLVEQHGLQGTLPTEIGLLSAVTNFGMRWNGGIDGTLPTEIGMMTLLSTYFGMEGIGFSSSLPTEVGRFTGLKSAFVIYNDGFTGPLPTEFARMGAGEFTGGLHIYNNEFSSTIPVRILYVDLHSYAGTPAQE